ncbi:hypothetical protein KUCAC02_016657 [Chaenocephalus aceratus]|nr:hypothetical protein KUCAC02_016657 [Chaenocephalus aceratus]
MVDRLANSEANSKRIGVVEGCFGTAGQPLFFLFNDILVYGNIVIQKKKYNSSTSSRWRASPSNRCPTRETCGSGWIIKTPPPSPSPCTPPPPQRSPSDEPHREVRGGSAVQKSGKAPTGEHAAVWIPDSEATVFMRCQKVKFTPVSRRHHCRKCGYVVCGPCSDKKFLLPSQSSKPVRVCEFCFGQLTAGGLAPRADSISRLGSKFNNMSDDDDDDDSSD